MSFEVLCAKAKEAILEMEEDQALEMLDEAISEGYDLMDLLAKGFASGMEELGQLFSDGQVFLPDLMYAADIMQQVTEKIEENLPAGNDVSKKGK